MLPGPGCSLAVLSVLQHDRDGDHDPSPPGDPPAAPAEPAREPARGRGAWSIPVAIHEWRAELERRNERFGEPEGYWCYVRPGTYRIGGWERGEEYADLELQAFWIARVPVTVAQYADFIEAGGYRERRWWTPHGWERLRGQKELKPWRWREAPFNSRARQALQLMILTCQIEEGDTGIIARMFAAGRGSGTTRSSGTTPAAFG